MSAAYLLGSLTSTFEINIYLKIFTILSLAKKLIVKVT